MKKKYRCKSGMSRIKIIPGTITGNPKKRAKRHKTPKVHQMGDTWGCQGC